MEKLQALPLQPQLAEIHGEPLQPNMAPDPSFPLIPRPDDIFRIQKNLRKFFLERWTKKNPKNGPHGESGEKRSALRYKFHSRVLAYALRPNVSGQPLRGGLRNLSKNGVCIECPETFSDAQLVLLDFQLPGQKNIQTPARVVWTKNKMSGLELLDPEGIGELLKAPPRP